MSGYKIIIPVVDTEQGKFEYNGRALTREEYGNMEYEQFRRTNRQVGRFVYNMAHGVSNFNGRMKNVDNTEHPDIIFKNEEADVTIWDVNKKHIPMEKLVEHAKDGKMFLLMLSIIPNTLSADAESELLFWIDDSTKVINDKLLPDDVKLKSLLGRDYAITDGETTIWITNCKMVQKYSKFWFAIIVEKAFIE